MFSVSKVTCVWSARSRCRLTAECVSRRMQGWCSFYMCVKCLHLFALIDWLGLHLTMLPRYSSWDLHQYRLLHETVPLRAVLFITTLTAVMGVGFHRNLSLLLCFSARYHENQCRITKLDIEMFHDESWKPVYIGVKGSRSRGTKTQPAWYLHSCECWLLLVNCPCSDKLRIYKYVGPVWNKCAVGSVSLTSFIFHLFAV